MKRIGLLILFFLFPFISNSQNKLGLGVYLGVPTGVTGKYLLSKTNSVDLLFAWRFNDAFFAQGHYNFNISEIDRYKDGVFNFYAGPGLFFKAISGKSRGEDSFGISGNFGLNYFLKQRYEFFFELSPKLGLVPATDFDLTGGIGFRFFF